MGPLRNAGIAIIAWFVLGIISSIYFIIKYISILGTQADITGVHRSLVNIPLSIIGSILTLVFVVIIFRGFISLGKRFNNKSLIRNSWILMILVIIYSGYGFVSFLLIKDTMLQNLTPDAILSQSLLPLIINYIIWFALIIAVLILTILFGTALRKLRSKVELVNTTGMLFIITGATLIIGVGYLVGVVAIIYSALMFLKASKKFETNQSNIFH